MFARIEVSLFNEIWYIWNRIRFVKINWTKYFSTFIFFIHTIVQNTWKSLFISLYFLSKIYKSWKIKNQIQYIYKVIKIFGKFVLEYLNHKKKSYVSVFKNILNLYDKYVIFEIFSFIKIFLFSCIMIFIYNKQDFALLFQKMFFFPLLY